MQQNYLIEFGYLANKSVPVTSDVKQTDISGNDGTGIKSATSNSTGGNASTTLVATTAPPTYEKPGHLRGLYGRGDIPRAIREFQHFMSLKETKILDTETVLTMRKPRYGVKDKTPHVTWIPDDFYHRRRRRYISPSKWSKKALTYTIAQASAKLSVNDQKSALAEAFKRWAEVCQLVFTYTDNKQASDISIRFASGE